MEKAVELDRGFTLRSTGLSGAGKTAIREIVEREMRRNFGAVEVLDENIVRSKLSKSLGFSREDGDANILRIGFAAKLLAQRGGRHRLGRLALRSGSQSGSARRRRRLFIEVFVDAPIDVCAERDVKGLYKQALAGETVEVYRGLRSL